MKTKKSIERLALKKESVVSCNVNRKGEPRWPLESIVIFDCITGNFC